MLRSAPTEVRTHIRQAVTILIKEVEMIRIKREEVDLIDLEEEGIVDIVIDERILRNRLGNRSQQQR